MTRPVFGATTTHDETIYRIDYGMSEADGEADTDHMTVRSPVSSTFGPGSSTTPDLDLARHFAVDSSEATVEIEIRRDSEPPTLRRGGHAFAETLPLLQRR